MAGPDSVESAKPVVNQAQVADGGPFEIKGLAWAVFEGARNPYYNLVVIYIFAHYFANVMVGGGELGLTISGLTITLAGIATAVTAPFLGAIADQAGNRKRAIAIFIGVLVLCSAALWWARPEGPITVWMTMAILAIAYCCYGYSEVLHNAMLPAAGRPSALPIISGLGLSMGNFLSVGILLFFLVGLMMPGTGLPFVPTEPLLPLDRAAHEPERFVGPFIAVWMTVLMIPFFMFMPEGFSQGLTWRKALSNLFRGAPAPDGSRQGIEARATVFGTYLVGLFKEYPQVMRFLIARTIFADAMSALLTLGAVFAGTFFGWSQIEIMIFGITGLLFGAIGGFVGGMLDRWLGPKRALVWELSIVTVLLFTQLSITPNSLFFGMIENRPFWDLPFFDTLADVVYFSFIFPVAIFVVAIITSARYMLVHIAPPGRIGEFFGLYAIAGTVTVWMGPGVVSLLTWLTGNQRIGMAGIGFMFIIGLAILWNVHAPKKPAQG